MNDSFFTGNIITFTPTIPLERILCLANCDLVQDKKNMFISFNLDLGDKYGAETYYFRMDYETKKHGTFLSRKKKYFMKSIYISHEYDFFEREVMFLMTYLLIKNTDIKFKIFVDISSLDLRTYNYNDIKENYSDNILFKNI